MIAECNLIGELSIVILEDYDLFEANVLNMLGYLLISTKAFAIGARKDKGRQNQAFLRIRKNLQVMLSVADKIFDNCLKLAEAGILQKIADLGILAFYEKDLPKRCAGVRDLFSYLVIEFLSKIQKSIDYVKEHGKV
jgi:hypothetical protein